MKNTDLLALHGWALHGGLLAPLAGHCPQACWQRYDLPGHGRARGLTWPDDIGVLLDDITARTPPSGWLLGWSLGGLLAMQAALRSPDRVGGLVLIAATPCFVRREHWPFGAEPGLLQAMALELADAPELAVKRFLALELRSSTSAGDEPGRLKQQALQHGAPDRQALIAALRHLAETDLTDRLEELDRPVLLIGGERDKLVPFRGLEAMQRRLPAARLIGVPGAAHAPFLTDPGTVANAVRDFIGEARHA